MSEDKKTKTADQINIKVLTQDNQVVQFLLKTTTPLKKLITAFCEKTQLDRQSLRFRFDGVKVNDYDTPAQLGMNEGDCIEVYQEQTGGCNWPQHLI